MENLGMTAIISVVFFFILFGRRFAVVKSLRAVKNDIEIINYLYCFYFGKKNHVIEGGREENLLDHFRE